ncbi:hypothetical protein [Streptococcus iniae]|uniref:hypothetical protein n=1 Tax=Streptococcus iniae TaxID=1346 RepID=UPI000EF74388|nr:hypothetical protein [Streptococcus iniae]RLV31193.1 hypothetical protein DIX49_09985 [Streptococcus iniae]
MGKRLYLDFNIRDRAFFITKKGQVFKGVVYKLDSLADDSYELYILVDSKDSSKFDYEIKLHESEIEDIKVLERNAIERGKTDHKAF